MHMYISPAPLCKKAEKQGVNLHEKRKRKGGPGGGGRGEISYDMI